MSGLERLWGLLQKAGYDTRAQRNAPLAPYTTYGVGGPADVLIIAETIDELATLVQMAHAAGVPGVVLGAGSNVLVADAGVRGLVILNRCVQHRIDDDGVLVAESGADLRKVARATVDAGWAGLDWAVGVPEASAAEWWATPAPMAAASPTTCCGSTWPCPMALGRCGAGTRWGMAIAPAP